MRDNLIFAWAAQRSLRWLNCKHVHGQATSYGDLTGLCFLMVDRRISDINKASRLLQGPSLHNRRFPQSIQLHHRMVPPRWKGVGGSAIVSASVTQSQQSQLEAGLLSWVPSYIVYQPYDQKHLVFWVRMKHFAIIAFMPTRAALTSHIQSSVNNVPGVSPPNSAARASAAPAPPAGRPVDGFPKDANDDGTDSDAS